MAKKILCTLGPSSLEAQIIRRLSNLQVDLFRINLSHTPVSQLEPMVKIIRSNSDVPICLDTQGAQARTGANPNNNHRLVPGEIVELSASEGNLSETNLMLHPPGLMKHLEAGDILSIDYDSTLLHIIRDSEPLQARVIKGGDVEPNIAVAISDRSLKLPCLTVSDHEALKIGILLGIEHFALSFASEKSDVLSLRQIVGNQAHIISKIESKSGLDNLADIISASDAILIDRGDLSREIALETLPFVQKTVIHSANQNNVPVYVATNLLESMVSSPQPTRAEVNDVINTLMDGADGLVLAAETAIGRYPIQCVNMIHTLINSYEMQNSKSEWNQTKSQTPTILSSHNLGREKPPTTIIGEPGIYELERQEITDETLMDINQIAVGAFAPLTGFMGLEVLESVLTSNRLPDGTAWPLPILLQLPQIPRSSFASGSKVALTNKGEVRAVLDVEECFTYDIQKLAMSWFGSISPAHPGVAKLSQGSNHFLAGNVDMLSEKIDPLDHYVLTPYQTRDIFKRMQWQQVIGFHSRNVVHRAHEYLQLTALAEHGCDGLFIHPVVGPKKSGDFSANIIIKTYEHILSKYYPENKAILSGFATYARYAGPREAVFTALCRKNFGCSHFIVGRDHTGVGNYYHPDAPKALFNELGDIGIEPIFFNEVYYCHKCRKHVENCGHGSKFAQSISGTTIRSMLIENQNPPEWYMRNSVSELIIDELSKGLEVFIP